MDSRKDDFAPDSIVSSLRYTLRLVWLEADPFTKRMLALSFGLLVIFSVTSALTPVIYKLLVDAFSNANTDANAAFWLIGAYIACQILFHTSGDMRGFVHGVGAQRLNRRISNFLFEHIVRLPLRFHLNRQVGAIGETISQGLSGCQTILQHFVFTFLPVAVEFAAITMVLLHFGHPRYLVVFGFSALAYVWIFWKGAAAIVEPSRAVSTANIDSQAVLADCLLNYESVKYFSGEPSVCAQYNDANVRRESAWRRLLKVRTEYALVATVIFIGSLGVAQGYAGYEVLHRTMTVGDFVLVTAYVGRLIQPLETIGFAVRDMSQALTYLQKMLEVLREPAETDSSLRASTDSPVRGEIEFRNVAFSYRPGNPVLDGVNFVVPAGKSVGIVGVSGSGKSSIIRLLFRMFEPSEGQILLDGKPISTIPLSELRGAIAVVPQDTVLFNDTIGRNIAFGRVDASTEEIHHAARLAHLEGSLSRLSDGLETKVGERGLKLSGGEKQRVAIARAALKRPRIFVFDEATSSLDSGTEKEILKNLVEVARGCTTLVIAHRLSTIAGLDEIIVLEGGQIVERGTHARLMSICGRYATLWRAQQAAKGDPESEGPVHMLEAAER